MSPSHEIRVLVSRIRWLFEDAEAYIPQLLAIPFISSIMTSTGDCNFLFLGLIISLYEIVHYNLRMSC